MTENESLSDRLNRLAQQKRTEREAEHRVRLTQEQVNAFVYANARPEFDKLLRSLEAKVVEVNAGLKDVPKFVFQGGVPSVRQGNVAAFLMYSQPILNAGSIVVRVSFGRELGGFYDGFMSQPPEPDRYELQPAMEHSPERIVWTGDLGEITSEQLSDFVLTHLTEYYLEHLG